MKQSIKIPTIIETIRLNRLRWFGHVQRMEENRIPKRVLYMNLGTTRLRGRPRNRGRDEVREDGRIVGGEGWQEKVHNREEWKKLLRTARNRHILHMPMEWMNEWSRILPEKPTGPQLSKKFTAYYVIRRFITAFARARHLSLSSARSSPCCPFHF